MVVAASFFRILYETFYIKRIRVLEGEKITKEKEWRKIRIWFSFSYSFFFLLLFNSKT